MVLLLGLLFSGITVPVVAAETVVVILLDDSGSMNDRMGTGRAKQPRMTVAKGALRKLISQLSNETQLGVMLLNGARASDGWLVPLGPLKKETTIARIESLDARGGTPLGSSIKTAMDALLDYRQRQPIGDYRLLVVTDGEANDADVLQRYLPDLVARGIFVDVIGVDMQSDHSLAARSHSYRRADDAASLEQALQEVFAESTHADDLDSAQADFDLIAGLPDEFARDALVTLSQLQNQPIGSPPSSDLEEEGAVRHSVPVSTSGSKLGFMSFLCMAAVGILMVIVIGVLMSVLSPRKK